jgi:hypothetical protein
MKERKKKEEERKKKKKRKINKKREKNKYVTPVFPKKTKCKPICMPGSCFMHIETYKCIQKQYHVRKREIIRDLCLILEMKAPTSQAVDWGLRTPSTHQHLHKTSE